MNAPAIRLDLFNPRLRVVGGATIGNAPEAANSGGAMSGELVNKSSKKSKAKPIGGDRKELARLCSQDPKVAEFVRSNPDAQGLLLESLKDRSAADRGKSLMTKKDARDAQGFERSGRHDELHMPPGYRYEDGEIFGPRDFISFKSAPVPSDRRLECIARGLLQSLACLFTVRAPGGKTRQLYADLKPQLRQSAFRCPLDKAEQLEKAYAAYYGKPYDYPRWCETLVAQLEMNERHRLRDESRKAQDFNEIDLVDMFGEDVAKKLRELDADSPGPEEIGAAGEHLANGRQILNVLIREVEESKQWASARGVQLLDSYLASVKPPAELTPSKIEWFMARGTLAKRGGGPGKTVGGTKRPFRTLVDEFAASLSAKTTKKLRK